MYVLCVEYVVDCRAHQTAASKSAVKKEKNKDKMRATETSIGAAVDEHSKSSADASKNDKSKDATHAHAAVSSESTTDRSELRVIQLTIQQTKE